MMCEGSSPASHVLPPFMHFYLHVHMPRVITALPTSRAANAGSMGRDESRSSKVRPPQSQRENSHSLPARPCPSRHRSRNSISRKCGDYSSSNNSSSSISHSSCSTCSPSSQGSSANSSSFKSSCSSNRMADTRCSQEGSSRSRGRLCRDVYKPVPTCPACRA